LSIALEVPDHMVGAGPVVGVWAAIGLRRDGMVVQMDRGGHPTINPVREMIDWLVVDLRAILVASGMLTARDERLVKLERWVTDTIATRAEATERQLLHRNAVWHHLRRLRRCLGADHASHFQALNVRCHTTAAVNFLDWLAAAT
jgi:hypothetical protein